MPKLTETSVKALKPSDKRYKIFDGDGLYIEVLTSGSKVWRIKYQKDGKDKRITLGSYPTVSLKSARDTLAKVRIMLLENKDPVDQLREKIVEEKHTFKSVTLDFIEVKKTRWTEYTYHQYASMCARYLFPTLGKCTLEEITPPMVLKILREVESKGLVRTQFVLLSLCSQIFRYGISCSICSSDPCRDLKGALAYQIQKPMAAVLSKDKIGELLYNIENFPSKYFCARKALLFTAYTFCRNSEVRCASWDEIDFDKKEWVIPEHRMKKRIEHRVPLSNQAISLLNEVRSKKLSDKWVFVQQDRINKPLNDSVMLFFLRGMGVKREEMTVHGFRAIASTHLNEMGYRPDLIERQLAHNEANKVRAAYNRAAYMDERRVMMQAWADYLDSLRDQYARRLQESAHGQGEPANE